MTEAEAPKPATPSATAPAPAAPSETTPKVRQAAGTAKRGGSALAVLALLLALGAAGAAGYPYYLTYQGQSDAQVVAATLSEALRSLRQESSAQAQALAEQRTAVAALQGALSEALSDAQRSREALAGELAALAQKQEAEQSYLGAVRMAEVRYLTAIATQRLRLERDLPGALALLARADAVLAEGGAASDVPLRRHLADALAALREAPRIDTVGLYLELEQIANVSDRLPLTRAQFTAEPASTPAPTRADGLLPWLWHKLQGLFRLRKQNEAVAQTLLPDGASVLLQHGLRLTLSQAQLALLRGDGPLWRASLEAAAQRIERYGRPSRDRSRLLERLGALVATPVAVEGATFAQAQTALLALGEALELRLGVRP